VTLDDLLASLDSPEPPRDLPPLVRALWLERRGDWDAGHRIAQEVGGPTGAWVHAYLHRKEGDDGNAAYWYRCAGRPPFRGDLAEEWRAIAGSLLGGAAGGE
jgi:hypothetical protein